MARDRAEFRREVEAQRAADQVRRRREAAKRDQMLAPEERSGVLGSLDEVLADPARVTPNEEQIGVLRRLYLAVVPEAVQRRVDPVAKAVVGAVTAAAPAAVIFGLLDPTQAEAVVGLAVALGAIVGGAVYATGNRDA